ncbi:MAG TPA: peptidylprolyl isomerase [Tepidisphaeraceae bacterium]|jgi:cyclophilin family peptidyl-prolyl cis-trans isomerase
MKQRRRNSRAKSSSILVQALEQRTLLSYSVVPNSAVVLNTSLGEVVVSLDTNTPITNANFLSYVTAGSYNGTVFHRIAVDGETQLDNNTETYSIVQGGGYTVSGTTFTPIATNPAITNESANPNSAGTIAMARTSSPDSATSQFFFNVSDNSSVFPDDPSDGYAVFGNVIRGMGVVDTIDSLNPETVGEFSNVPEINTGTNTTESPFVTITTATEEDTMTVTMGPNDASGTHSVSFQDTASGAGTTISLSGANSTLTFTGTHLSAKQVGGRLIVSGVGVELDEIQSSNTTTKSSLMFSSVGRTKHVDVGDININGSIGSILGGDINVTGDIDVSGSVGMIRLLSSTAAGVINIGTSLSQAQAAAAPATFINIPFLTNISIESSGSIKELLTRSYQITDGTNRAVQITGAVEKFVDYGVMEAGINAGAIGTYRSAETTSYIAGQSTIGTIKTNILEGEVYSGGAYAAGTLGIHNIDVTGAIEDTEIISLGNIGNIHAGSMIGVDVAAGYNSSDTAADNFESPLGSNAILQSLSLRAPKGPKGASFSDSQIQAYQINSLNLGRISTTVASGSELAISGIQTTHLLSLNAVTENKKLNFHLSNIKSTTTLNNQLKNAGIDLNPSATIGTISTGTTSTSGLVNTAGYTYNSLTLNSALVGAIPAGTAITVSDGTNSQTVTLSAAANVGDTALSVTPFTASAAIATGATLQGTLVASTATGLTSGLTYNAINLTTALNETLAAGSSIVITAADGTTQTLTLSADAESAATSISVTPFVANDTYDTTATVASSGTSLGTLTGGTVTGLTSGVNYSSIALTTALTESLAVGSTITITASDNTTQTLTVSAAAASGATSISVNPFTANDTYIGSTATVADSTGTSLGTLSSGTPTATGTLTTATATTSGLISGVAYTAITLNSPTTAALTSGQAITLISGTNTQTAALGAAASSGATTLTTSLTANNNYPAGTTIKGVGFTIDIIPVSDIGVASSSS